MSKWVVAWEEPYLLMLEYYLVEADIVEWDDNNYCAVLVDGRSEVMDGEICYIDAIS